MKQIVLKLQTATMRLLLPSVLGCAASCAIADEAVKKTGPVGKVVGKVTFTGSVPKARIADNLGHRRPLLNVNAKTNGLQYVAVFLVAENGEFKANRVDDESLRTFVIDQEDETFLPHLVAVHDGQPVRFTNSDQANHNVRSAALDERNQFNVFTPASGTSYTHRFRAGRNGRPIRVGCDIHAWMCAWVYVFDHPYFAVTDEKGQFRIVDVPPGKYGIHFRQPDVGFLEERKVTVEDGKAATVSIRFERVGDGQ